MHQKKCHTIMLVDDDSIECRYNHRLLDKLNICENIVQFHLAEPAINYLDLNECENIDLILLDLKLPSMDGYDFLAEIRKKSLPLHASIVLLTSSRAYFDASKIKDYPEVVKMVEKPLLPEHILGLEKKPNCANMF